MTWAEYIGWLVDEHGSLAAAAQKAAGTEHDAASVERALRRLRLKKYGNGGDWGRRLLRTFGLPKQTADRVRWMGLYHSRFTDLPVDLCLDQLRAWSRPPVSESTARTGHFRFPLVTNLTELEGLIKNLMQERTHFTIPTILMQ